MTCAIEVNIGLKIGRTDELIEPAAAVDALNGIEDWKVLAGKVVASGTEPTLVAWVAVPTGGFASTIARRIERLCGVLGQEAIAWRELDGTGHLDGPGKANWGGKFDPAYFIPFGGPLVGL